MRIIYYIHSLQTGGAEILVEEYLCSLKNRGHDVALVINNRCSSDIETRLTSKLPIYALLSYDIGDTKKSIRRSVEFRFRRLIYRRKWKAIIRSFKPDFIHIHTLANDIDTIPFPAEKMIYTFHTDVQRSISLSKQSSTKNLQALAKAGLNFFAINKQIQKDIREKFNAERVFYTPNGIDIDRILSTSLDRRKFLGDYNLPANVFVVGHVGRFNPVKNHEKVFSVFAEIVKRNSSSILLLIGRGSNEENKKVKAMAEAAGVSKKVLFLGERSDSTEVMSIMDVLLFPSRVEGFPLTLLEAQARGLRCIISDTIPDDVICNGNCIPLSLDCSDAVWAAMACSSYVSHDCKDIFQFNIDRVVDTLESYYYEIMGNKGECHAK